MITFFTVISKFYYVSNRSLYRSLSFHLYLYITFVAVLILSTVLVMSFRYIICNYRKKSKQTKEYCQKIKAVRNHECKVSRVKNNWKSMMNSSPRSFTILYYIRGTSFLLSPKKEGERGRETEVYYSVKTDINDFFLAFYTLFGWVLVARYLSHGAWSPVYCPSSFHF